MMRIDVLTLFPKMVEGPLGESIIGKAIEKGLLEINVHDFRAYSGNKHMQVDDYPYGGGAGMLLKVQPIYDNLKAIEEETGEQKKRVILSCRKTFQSKYGGGIFTGGAISLHLWTL
jgi:tRNA (guanine37-N1)-methyltransferase